ncbi:MAG: baseplate J/gp47 family protein [Acidaminococcus intestini]
MYSINQIHNTILQGVPDDYQKTEGFPTYDITRGVSFGQYQLWKKAFLIEEKQNVDNLEGTELDVWCAQRVGLTRNTAVTAKAVVKIVAGAGRIIQGDLFETEDGIQFSATETKTVAQGDTVTVEAVEAGTAGNVAADTIVKMPVTINGIGSFTNPAPAEGGYSAETDDEFRKRYYEKLQIPATCGNKYHYLAWAKAVDGVGNARVFPCWAGRNTVKVVIIGNDSKPASESLVKDVQDYIDPGKTGRGDGEAPVGAVCTVKAADTVSVSVSVSVSEDLETIKDNVTAAIADYIKSQAFAASDAETDYISYARIGAAIIGTTGVLDYADLRVNGGTKNIVIPKESVAVLGDVTYA